ncbi:DedA family protein [Candidatus Micrarchaeota archaeon]|nr:DedA family protein [Candidatus Micrarchaeota archaeon]
MDKRKAAVEIIFAILIIIAVFALSDKISELQQFGYAGVFVISLLSAATIFFPAPGWAAVIAMGGVLNPYLVGIAAGVGSGIGEITGYMVGNGITELSDARLEGQKKMIRKYGSGIIFLLAFIPNPLFDVAGLAAGAMKMNVLKFIALCILGRTIRYILLAHLGMFIGPYVL